MGFPELTTVASMLLLVVIGISMLVTGTKPNVVGFARCAGVTLDAETGLEADTQLRRTNRWRALGALLGFAASIPFGLRVLGAVPITVTMLGGIMLGALAGLVAAQIRVATTSTAVRSASLEVRAASDYEPTYVRFARPFMLVALVASVVTAVVVAVRYGTGVDLVAIAVPSALVVVLFAVSIWAERRIAMRGRVRTDAPGMAVDDALRRVAMHALVWGTFGLMFFVIATNAYVVVRIENVGGVEYPRENLVWAKPANATAIGIYVPTEGVTTTDATGITTVTPKAVYPAPLVVEWIDDTGNQHRDRLPYTLQNEQDVMKAVIGGTTPRHVHFSAAMWFFGATAATWALISWFFTIGSWKRGAARRAMTPSVETGIVAG